MRDFQRILSLTKSVAIIRHHHRLVDGRGYLIAQIDDYQTVHDLIGEMYETTAGVSPDVREAVEAVKRLRGAGQERISATKVGDELGIGKTAAARRLGVALKEGWLLNDTSWIKGRPWDLQVGEPLPDPITLPTPDSLVTVSGCFAGVSLGSREETSTECFGVSTVFGGSVADTLEV